MIDHEAITKVIFKGGRAMGKNPNPYANKCNDWERRKANASTIAMINEKIAMPYEPMFTPPATESPHEINQLDGVVVMAH